MSGGGNKTQSVTTSSPELPANVKGAMDSSLGSAQSLFNSGSLYKPYTGSTVVPYDANTTAGMSQSIADSDAARPWMQMAFNRMGDVARGANLAQGQTDSLKRLEGLAGGTELNKFASGAYLDGSNNPYFSQVVDRAAEGARDAVNMNFSGAGRYGSGANQQILAREVGDLTNRAYSGQYQNEVGNMMGANSALQGLSGDIFNGYQQGYDNSANAAMALQPMYAGLQGLNNARFSVGSMNEDLNARQMNDALRIWQEQQQQPMKSVEWLNGIASGAGALTGGQTQTIQTPKTSPFMAGLGGAATGFGVGGPVGAAIGGGAGLLSSLF